MAGSDLSTIADPGPPPSQYVDVKTVSAKREPHQSDRLKAKPYGRWRDLDPAGSARQELGVGT